MKLFRLFSRKEQKEKDEDVKRLPETARSRSTTLPETSKALSTLVTDDLDLADPDGNNNPIVDSKRDPALEFNFNLSLNLPNQHDLNLKNLQTHSSPIIKGSKNSSNDNNGFIDIFPTFDTPEAELNTQSFRDGDSFGGEDFESFPSPHQAIEKQESIKRVPFGNTKPVAITRIHTRTIVDEYEEAMHVPQIDSSDEESSMEEFCVISPTSNQKFNSYLESHPYDDAELISQSFTHQTLRDYSSMVQSTHFAGERNSLATPVELNVVTRNGRCFSDSNPYVSSSASNSINSSPRVLFRDDMNFVFHRSNTTVVRENMAKIIKASETLSFLKIDHGGMSKKLEGSASEYWDNIAKGGEIIRYDVKEHNTTRRPTVDRIKDKKRFRIVKELTQTEIAYVDQLQTIEDVHLIACKRNNILNKNDLDILFPQIDLLLRFHGELKNALENELEKWNDEETCIGKLVCEFIVYFKMYSFIITNQQAALEHLESSHLRKHKKFQRHLEETKLEGLSLEQLLIVPVQRLPRYILLLKDLLKRTDEDHIDFPHITNAYNELKKTVEDINTAMTIQDQRGVVFDLSKRFYGDPKLVASHRRLVREDRFEKYCENRNKWKSYYVFLFNDLLLYAHHSAAFGLKVHKRMIIDSKFNCIKKDDIEAGFEIHCGIRERPFIFRCPSVGIRDEWFRALHDWCDVEDKLSLSPAMRITKTMMDIFASGGDSDNSIEFDVSEDEEENKADEDDDSSKYDNEANRV